MIGDQHALDDQSRPSGPVLRAVGTIFGNEPLVTAQHRRLLRENAGVSADELSTLVLTAGIHPDDKLIGRGLLHRLRERRPGCRLALAHLWASVILSFPAAKSGGRESGVLALALSSFGPRRPPLVSLSGWPSTVGGLLLRSLQCRVNYHGDFGRRGHSDCRVPDGPNRRRALADVHFGLSGRHTRNRLRPWRRPRHGRAVGSSAGRRHARTWHSGLRGAGRDGPSR